MKLRLFFSLLKPPRRSEHFCCHSARNWNMEHWCVWTASVLQKIPTHTHTPIPQLILLHADKRQIPALRWATLLNTLIQRKSFSPHSLSLTHTHLVLFHNHQTIRLFMHTPLLFLFLNVCFFFTFLIVQLKIIFYPSFYFYILKNYLICYSYDFWWISSLFFQISVIMDSRYLYAHYFFENI